MPELPEVETVRRTLRPALGLRVERVWGSRGRLRGVAVPAAALRRAAVGASIEDVRRWGKYLLVDFAGRRQCLVTHLGMTGRLRIHDSDDPRVPHTHLVIGLSRGRELRFSDPRRFGHLSLARRGREREHPPLAVLGTDALSDELDGELLYRASRGSRRVLKGFLLAQDVVAGLGNIYVSEALWLARIHPTSPAGRLARGRAERLARAIRDVLHRALDHGGTSLRDFVAADGVQGENAHYLRVYDRASRPCPRRGCGGVIRRRVIGGRSTFYCPRCQRW